MYKIENKIDDSITRKLKDKLKKKWTPKLANVFSPNFLSILGLISSVFAGLCFYLTQFSEYWLFGAAAAILINCFADEFDGEVARYKKEATGHGFFTDRMFDQLGFFLVMLGLGLSPLMQLPLALLLVVVYFIISMNVFLMAYATGKFRIAYGKFGPVELRLGFVIYCICTPFSKYIYPYVLSEGKFLGITPITSFDLIALIGIAIFALIAIFTIVENFTYLFKVRKKILFKSQVK
ncbi:MAG: CDP-alcohol phosphatidyltransferase family protein [archaeon]|nr:MAG: CDP-alcohol phosphatidyltransferase family protein [archaeon]